ncbi:MAG: aminotransferase class IV [Saprospiraceae bacterium]|jgi:4-amino-4-deoxychorismate lyase|nr:aminotransferase class IV [Saprospiraceae bacterium]MBP9208908.1 aminotransferase class IV [Saprospiraceae bacterium]MBV6472092.1 hypothetical protein [Saprospiraceae bacterium]
MFPFFESIAIVHGNVRNLQYHQQRVFDTIEHFFPGNTPLHLEDLIPKSCKLSANRVKWKLQYSSAQHFSQVQIYLQLIHSHFVLTNCGLSYPFKSTRRDELNSLKDGLAKDVEVIIVKNGEITDTSYSNLAFWDGNHWYTPSKPLLKGTMRAQLLDAGKVRECIITPSGLSKYSHFKCINAMNNLEEAPIYSIQSIRSRK